MISFMRFPLFAATGAALSATRCPTNLGTGATAAAQSDHNAMSMAGTPGCMPVLPAETPLTTALLPRDQNPGEAELQLQQHRSYSLCLSPTTRMSLAFCAGMVATKALSVVDCFTGGAQSLPIFDPMQIVMQHRDRQCECPPFPASVLAETARDTWAAGNGAVHDASWLVKPPHAHAGNALNFRGGHKLQPAASPDDSASQKEDKRNRRPLAHSRAGPIGTSVVHVPPLIANNSLTRAKAIATPPEFYVLAAIQQMQARGALERGEICKPAPPPPQSARDVCDAFNAAGTWSLPPGQQGGAPTWDEFKHTFRPWVDMGTVPEPEEAGMRQPVPQLPVGTGDNGGDGTTGFSYQFIHPWDKLQVGLKGWFNGEFHAWNTAFTGNQFVPFIEVGGKDPLFSNPGNHFVSYAAYMLSDWQRPIAGLVPRHFNPPVFGPDGKPAVGPDGKPFAKKLTVRVRDLDFYKVDPKTKKLTFNWCLVDLVGILQQGGHDLGLPKSKLHDNPATDYLPPRVMDGSPAPRRFGPLSLDEGRAKRACSIVHTALSQDFCEESTVGVSMSAQPCGLALGWADDLTWYGPVGIGTAHSRRDFVDHFLQPFNAAFAGVRLDYDVLVCEGNYCAAHLRVIGAHVGEWLGVKPKDPRHPRQVSARMGLHFRVRDQDDCDGTEAPRASGPRAARGRPCAVIQEGWSQIDLLGALEQMGRDVIAELREKQREEGIGLEDYV